MGISVFPLPSAASKTMFRTTLTSGSSYTVPAGVTYLNVTLIGAGGGGAATDLISGVNGIRGNGGQIVSSTLTATAGNTINYAIGAGGAAGTGGGGGSTGGTTTFTGATSAVGGIGGSGLNDAGRNGTDYLSANNGGAPGGGGAGKNGGTGGSGSIIVEYWV